MKITVATVCFNASRTIRQTIESVRCQTGVDVEHIIVDGGSTDGTINIINEYRDGITHFISEPDRGVYDAMQKGLMLATGDYTGFLNADDYFDSCCSLAMLTRPLKTGDFLGAVGMIEQIDSAGRTRRIMGSTPFYEKNLQWGIFPPHPATYLCTSLMHEAGGFNTEFRLVGDMDLFVRVLDLGKQPIAHVQKTIVKMRLGGLSTSGLHSYLQIGREKLKILRNSGRYASALKIHSRILVKMRELHPARTE